MSGTLQGNQVAEERPLAPMETPQGPVEPTTATEYDYRPLTPLAPVTLVLGLCSLLATVAISALAISLAGVLVGLWCLVRIRRSDGELGGKRLALVGWLLSLMTLFGGSALHAYIIATEVPEGYRRVNFTQEIAAKKPVVEDGVARVHPDVRKLDGERIFVKGYMYPTKQLEGLDAFILVKDNQQCCFGGQPALTDMILVRMRDGLTVDYLQGLVAVGGVFQTHDLSRGGALQPVYELEGEYFGPARTQF